MITERDRVYERDALYDLALARDLYVDADHFYHAGHYDTVVKYLGHAMFNLGRADIYLREIKDFEMRTTHRRTVNKLHLQIIELLRKTASRCVK